MTEMAFIQMVLILVVAVGCFDQYKQRHSPTIKRIASGTQSFGLALGFAGWVLGLPPVWQITASVIGLSLILFSIALQLWDHFVTPEGQRAEFLGKKRPIT